jgi:hypothetical protein
MALGTQEMVVPVERHGLAKRRRDLVARFPAAGDKGKLYAFAIGIHFFHDAFEKVDWKRIKVAVPAFASGCQCGLPSKNG